MARKTEIEAKLLAPDRRALDELAAGGTLAGYRLRPKPEVELETVYLDTPRGDLGRAGVGFRVRRYGRRWEATMKLPGEVAGGLHRRPEWTVPLARGPRFPFLPPAGPLRDCLLELTGYRPLVPLLQTRIRRGLLLATRPGTRIIVAEIALDRIEFRRPRGRRGDGRGRRHELEIEIELRRGNESDLVRLAHALRRRYRLRPTSRSKLERGLRWAGLLARAATSRRSRPTPRARA